MIKKQSDMFYMNIVFAVIILLFYFCVKSFGLYPKIIHRGKRLFVFIEAV